MRSADAAPGESVIAAYVNQNAVTLTHRAQIVGRGNQRRIDESLFERGDARRIGAAGENRDVFFWPQAVASEQVERRAVNRAAKRTHRHFFSFKLTNAIDSFAYNQSQKRIAVSHSEKS